MLIYRNRKGEIEPRNGIVIYRYGVDMLIKMATWSLIIADPYDATVFQEYGARVNVDDAILDYIHRYKNGLIDKTVIVE